MKSKGIISIIAVIYFCIGFYFYFPAIGYLSSCSSIVLNDMSSLFLGRLINGVAGLIFLFIPVVIFFKKGMANSRLIIQQIMGLILLFVFMAIFKSLDKSTCLLGDTVYDMRILTSMAISIVVSMMLSFRMRK